MNGKNLIATLFRQVRHFGTVATLVIFASAAAHALDLGNNAPITAVQQTDGSGNFAATHRVAFQFTAETSDTLQTLYLNFLWTNNYSVNIFLLDTSVDAKKPYTNTVGDSNVILISTISTTITAAGWKSCSVTQPLVAGNAYWIVINYTASSGGATNSWAMVNPSLNQDVATGQQDLNQEVLYSTGAAVQWQQASGVTPTYMLQFASAGNFMGNSYTVIDASATTNSIFAGTHMQRQYFVNDNNVTTYNGVAGMFVADLEILLVEQGVATTNLLYSLIEDPFGANVTLINAATFQIPAGVSSAPSMIDVNGFLPQYTFLKLGKTYMIQLSGGTSNSKFFYAPTFETSNVSPFPSGTYQGTNADAQKTINSGGTWSEVNTGQGADMAFLWIRDTIAPDITITQPNPVTNAVWNLQTMPNISGNATDNYIVATTSGVDVAILDIGAGQYWNQSSLSWVTNSGTVVWNSTTTTGGASATWLFNVAQASAAVSGGTNNHEFQIVARSRDGSNNVAVNYSTVTVVVDFQAPTSAPTYPASGNPWLGNVNTLTGTGSDNTFGGVAVLGYAVKQLSNNKWWVNASSTFSSTTEVFNTGSVVITPSRGNSVTWSASTTGGNLSGNLTNGTTYAVYSQAQDLNTTLGNVYSPNIQVSYTTNTFRWDSLPPISTITAPANGGTVGQNTTFVITATDTLSGINGSKFSYILEDVTHLAYWNNTNHWQGTQPATLPLATWFTSSATISGVDFTGKNGDSILLVPIPQDIAGNNQTSFVVGSASNTYIADLTAPQSLITVPSSNFTNSLPQIQGSVSDNASGISTVNIQISSPAVSPTSYWNGASWQGTQASTTTTVFSSSWSYTVPGGLVWQNGQTYNIQTQAIDSVGNQETLGANGNLNFTYIVTLPSSTIQVPVANNFYNSFTSFSGTAAVTTAGDQINNIQMAIQDTDTQDWWLGGTSWGNTGSIATWTNVNNPGLNWSENPLPAGMFNGRSNHQISFRSRAQDRAGNFEQNGNGNTPFNVVFDTNPPTSSINAVAAVVSTITIVNGLATDFSSQGHSRMNGVQVNLFDTSAGQVWDGFTWISTQTINWRPATYNDYQLGASSGTWSYTLPNLNTRSGHQFQINSQAFDKATNFEVAYTTITFTFDNSAPTSAPSTPANNAYINQPLATVSGTESDNVSLQEVRIEFSRIVGGTTFYLDVNHLWTTTYPSPLPLFTGGSLNSWTYNVSSVTFPNIWDTPNVVYHVASYAKDQAGNAQTVITTNTFTYDTYFPTAAITYPINGLYVSQTGQVNGTVADNYLTGNVFVRISTNNFHSFWTGSGSSWTASTNTWLTATLNTSLLPNATSWVLALSPWVTNVTFSAEAYAVDQAGNSQIIYSTVTFTADFTAPISTITSPNIATLTNALTSISGNATDYAPGQLAKVQLSYYQKSGGTHTGQYWNPASQSFNSGVQIFSTTTLTGNTWQASGPNIAVFETATSPGVVYDIFSQAVDAAGNAQSQPGSPTIPPATTSYIEITLITPQPVSVITSPSGSPSYFQPNTVSLQGTVQFDTTVQVQILDCGANLTCNSGNESLAFNGSAFVSTNTFNGFVGVTSVFSSSTSWTMTVPNGDWFNGTHLYQINSQGVNQALSLTETPGPKATFVVDNNAPAENVTVPNGAAYVNNLPTLVGTASDTSPGAMQSVVFRVINGGKFWNWQSSTFTALSGAATDLTASFGGGLWTYTTDYFQVNTGTGAWQNGQSYTVRIIATDQAGNSNFFDQTPFTFDTVVPTATIVMPTNGLTAIRSLPISSGTATDNNLNTNVQIAIRNQTGLWYDGSLFEINQSTPYFISMTSLSANATYWTYTAGGALDSLLLDNQKYTLVVGATDSAGNAQATYPVGISSLTITMDFGQPRYRLPFLHPSGSSFSTGE